MAQPQRQHEPQTLFLQRHFDASPERVFHAFTDPSSLEAWFGPEGMGSKNCTVDLRPGGKYYLEMHEPEAGIYPLSGEYVEIDPPHRLVMTWTWRSGNYAGIDTLVTIELKKDGDGTLLSLTHENLDGIEARDLHAAGWHGGFAGLDRLLAID